jgi:hypothetical protein
MRQAVMDKRFSGLARAAIPVALVAALFAGSVDAKGGRRSSSFSSSKSHGSSEHGTDSGSYHPSVTVRPSTSSPDSDTNAGPATQPVPVPRAHIGAPAKDSTKEPVLDAEEEARRAANLAIYQRQQAEREAAAKAAAEKAEADRIALDKLTAARNAQFAQEQRAAAARLAAEREKKRGEAAAVAADVERVLQRARADYPMLSTPEGQLVLRKIMDRQQELAARGTYPSIAMVEAISDHAHALVPRRAGELRTVSTNASAQAEAAKPRAFDGCRWVTPIKWACD